MNFRESSVKLNAALTKDTRKVNGIYFTPRNVRNRLFTVIKELGVSSVESVLEPSFGSGEFLADLATEFPGATVFGVEKHKELFDSVQGENLTHGDFLEYAADPVDLIVGNPPYFVTKLKEPLAMSGRGNIFVLFVYRCMKEGGHLAFVLPTSFYNCSYYEPCRRYIRETCTILHVENLDGGFYDTVQDTMLLVLKKGEAGGAYFLERGGNLYISPHATQLRGLLSESSTLATLGFKVKTGEVVWNQEKASLTTDGDGGDGAYPVIYSNNIVGGEVRLLDEMGGEKKQFIKGDAWKKPAKGPALLVTRGYGNKYHFNYAFVPEGFEFYGENHVNVIMPRTQEAMAHIDRIKKSLEDPRTAEFIRMFVGNGALSKTELESVFPVF